MAIDRHVEGRVREDEIRGFGGTLAPRSSSPPVRRLAGRQSFATVSAMALIGFSAFGFSHHRQMLQAPAKTKVSPKLDGEGV